MCPVRSLSPLSLGLFLCLSLPLSLSPSLSPCLSYFRSLFVCLCLAPHSLFSPYTNVMCVCVRACVRVCARVCVHVCIRQCVRPCVRVFARVPFLQCSSLRVSVRLSLCVHLTTYVLQVSCPVYLSPVSFSVLA